MKQFADKFREEEKIYGEAVIVFDRQDYQQITSVSV